MYLFELWFSPDICWLKLLDHMVVLCLRNLHTILHNSCTSLHSHQQCRKVLFPPYFFQHLWFIDFFDRGHSDWCKVIPDCSFNLYFSNN